MALCTKQENQNKELKGIKNNRINLLCASETRWVKNGICIRTPYSILKVA